MTALDRRMRSVLHRRCAQHDGRRGDQEVPAVVLADAEHVEPEPIRGSTSSISSRMR